jgi:hypothetical protein
MTQRLLALGALMAITTIAAHAQKTYTSAASFLADAKLSYSDDFSSVADGGLVGAYTAPGGSGLGFSVSATDGLWSVGGGNISTSTAGASMTINFTGDVNMVGGSFWAADMDGVATPGTVTLTFSDGGTYTSSSDAFFGYSNANAWLTSMTLSLDSEYIDSNSFSTFQYGSLDGLTVGQAVPEPGTYAAFALLGTTLGAAVIRRRKLAAK